MIKLMKSVCLGSVETPLHSCANLTEEFNTAKERRLNQFGTAVLMWCDKNVKFDKVCWSIALFDFGAEGDS